MLIYNIFKKIGSFFEIKGSESKKMMCNLHKKSSAIFRAAKILCREIPCSGEGNVV